MKECLCHGIQELSPEEQATAVCGSKASTAMELRNQSLCHTDTPKRAARCIQDEIYPHNWDLADPFTPSFISFFVHNSYIPEQKWKYI